MTHYLEFNIKSSKQKNAGALMSSLLNKVHHTIVKLNTNQLGVSFPGYGTTLGNVLRVHAEPHLLKLFILNLDEFDKAIKVSDIMHVPSDITMQYALFSRVRPSHQNSKLQAKISSGHITNPKDYIKKMCEELLSEPFFNARSTSTQQSYKRFVKREIVEHEQSGEFDNYGMSKTATVPIF